MVTWRVPLFALNFDSRERDAAAAVVESGWLTMGERTIAFEEAFAAFLGGGVACTAVSSCTAALHMALLALGVGPGDEVVIPALTFVADANVVRMVGAKPVLADCASLDDWNVSADTLARQLTDRTRAVIVVHYAGYPCAMRPILDLCRARGIALVEDVAHAPGASLGGVACGRFGDVGCFSFFSNKNLSIGEGGMAVATAPGLHDELRRLRSHGMTTLTLDRHKGRAISYDVVRPGLNYRMDEIRAALGLVQLAKLPAANRRRRALTEAYRAALARTPVAAPFAHRPSEEEAAYHIMPVLLPEGVDRTAVINQMKVEGIQTSIHYPPFWGFTAYRDEVDEASCPVAAEVTRRVLTLPLFPGMEDEDVARVVDALARAV
jgi:dTDP-4-amino-4,6-dideoxygalactose transaminase